MGWGWGQLWAARRPLRLLGCYAVSVTVHGLWNAVTVGTVLLRAGALVHEGDAGWGTLAPLGVVILVGLLGLLSIGAVIALPLAGRRLAEEVDQLQDNASSSEEDRVSTP